MTAPNAYQYDPGIYVETGWRTDLENVPNDGSEFLVFTSSHKEQFVAYRDGSLFCYGCIKNEDGTQTRLVLSDVTHWQPLPPPPAPERREPVEPGTLITGEADDPYNGQGTPEDALR